VPLATTTASSVSGRITLRRVVVAMLSLVQRLPRIAHIALFALLVLSTLGGADPWFC
jgi:hypothetical protein